MDGSSKSATRWGVHVTSSHCCQPALTDPYWNSFEFHYRAFYCYTYEQFHSSCGFLIETTSGLSLAVRVGSLQVKKKSQLNKKIKNQ